MITSTDVKGKRSKVTQRIAQISITLEALWDLLTGYEHISKGRLPKDVRLESIIFTPEARQVLHLRLTSSEFPEIPEGAEINNMPVRVNTIGDFDRAVLDGITEEKECI